MMQADSQVTFSQAQCYAVLALKKMIEVGRLQGSKEDMLRAIDYAMHEIATDDGITPGRAEVQVRELDIISGFGPLKIYQYDHSGDCTEWIIAASRKQADNIYKQYLSEALLPAEVEEINREQFISKTNGKVWATQENLDSYFENAPCHLARKNGDTFGTLFFP